MHPLATDAAGATVNATMILASVASIGMVVSAAFCSKWCQKKTRSSQPRLSVIPNHDLNPFEDGKHRTNPIFERGDTGISEASNGTKATGSQVAPVTDVRTELPPLAPVGFDERAQRLAAMRQLRQARKQQEATDLDEALRIIDNLE
eukprot:m.441401 g.441401  ORF g.441401 m.441401 type:complete len:147 (-) comp18656_c0_seq1:1450-1890(-)